MFNFTQTHASWQPILRNALMQVDPHYIETLTKNPNWLPGFTKMFNAFSLPLEKTRYILFGESPYPRAASANGYAFWDNAVHDLWSNTGLSKKVNRATSLRNMIKMLMVAQKLLSNNNTSQQAIAQVNKFPLVQTIEQLFDNFMSNGFLLLNASLALGADLSVPQHAKKWLPFIKYLLEYLSQNKEDITLILFGNIAKIIQSMPQSKLFSQLVAEHPYNISFITNQKILQFFEPFQLLTYK
ncbi:MAG: uracil-DNA glycosylase [Legionellales bacterium]|nr:uracil-DNA glycosylase [Legionellales bacterium]|tara:strand:+ start:283 stop:1005 length:723 start_codon:yes stop_codon:yes gene_type:complete